jgi:predicted nucleic-acid-binding protein
VRLVTRDDPRQVARAEDFVGQGAWVSTLALAEATWVLEAVYERAAAQIGAAVEMILNQKKLVIQDAEAVAKALENFRKRPALGFSDCLMLEIARKAGHLPLGAFDRNLARLDGAERL